MSFYKFKRGDILLNTLTARPEYNFFIYNQNRYLNHKNIISGAYAEAGKVSSITNVPPGYINLYELNVNRDFAENTYKSETGTGTKTVIFPWIYAKQDSYLRLSPMTSGSQKINSGLDPAVEVTGSYPLSSSISYYYYASTDTSTKLRLESLRNTVNYYRDISPHFVFSGDIPDYNANTWRTRNLNTEDVGLISIPAIIHGGGLKRGSVSLKFYISGTLAGEVTDINNERGELIQVSGTHSANDGKVAGIVLYNEGAILLTGSWTLNTEHTEQYLGTALGSLAPSWKFFGSTIHSGEYTTDAVTTVSSSYTLDFKATEKIPNLTMLTYANRGDLNYSNNPTFISSSKDNVPLSGAIGYFEPSDREIKNIVSSSYTQTTGSFEKITYITKVGIYDQYKNLIAVANMANPVRKREQDSYTFKLKIDL